MGWKSINEREEGAKQATRNKEEGFQKMSRKKSRTLFLFVTEKRDIWLKAAVIYSVTLLENLIKIYQYSSKSHLIKIYQYS